MIAQYETKLRCRKLDANGDMVFGMNDAGILDGLEAMKQVLKTRLASVAGEWWEGDDGALPYFSGMMGLRGSEANRRVYDLMVVERIMDTRGVISVGNIESKVSGRRYSFRCTVNTVYGQTTTEFSA